MSDEQFPTDLVISVDDFRHSGWRETITNASKHSYNGYWQSFSGAARKLIDAGEKTKGKALWLIADACSMMLHPESVNEPFRPLMNMIGGKRTAIIEDFSEIDFSFFKNILPEIDDFRLKARIADILWFASRPRNVQDAFTAIDAYQQFPLDSQHFVRDSEAAWHRAIRLCQMLRDGDRLQTICKSLLDAFKKAIISEKFYALQLSNLMEIDGLENEQSLTVSIQLESFAQHAEEEKDWNRARQYYEGAITWHKRLKVASDIHRLNVRVAETFVSEASQRAVGNNASNMVAGYFLECAIHTYRKIPNKERAIYKADERIEELHKKMNSANKLGLNEMVTFETPKIDISPSIEASWNHVTGRNFPDVLVAFSNIYAGVKVDDIREIVKKNMQGLIFRRLFGSSHITRDGRTAARSSGVNFDDMDSPDAQQAVWQDMIQYYGINIGAIVQANIIPALQVINAEHRITERALLSLCRYARVIPSGREVLWAKGLFFGFEADFVVSTHLLVPQMEHLVRTLFKQNGIRTTTLDSKGIETENGLSTLMDNPDIEKTMHKNLAFELKALLADSIGPNMRNEVAHGLLEVDSAMSIYAIYLWWLCLRLMINSITWNADESSDYGDVPQ